MINLTIEVAVDKLVTGIDPVIVLVNPEATVRNFRANGHRWYVRSGGEGLVPQNQAALASAGR